MTEDKEPLKMEIANYSDPLVATNLHGVISHNTVMCQKHRFQIFLANLYMCASD